MVKEFNILIAGVGGQGVIVMSELLGKTAVSDGLKVRGSEILGMAVRGGSVVSIIRVGEEVFGPLIPEGKCDIIIGMEITETLRNIVYLSKSSIAIVNSRKAIPPTVSLGLSSYPREEQILEKLNGITERTIVIDAERLAKKSGNLLSANIVMLGALFGTRRVPLKIETVKDMIKGTFPKQAGVNIRAFDSGYKAYQQALA
jgi:indolepyruvate ferredoxin oxidoreductase beta subunit